MTEPSHPFGARSPDDLPDLLRQSPLAWLVSGAAETFCASLLPLLPLVDGEGRLAGFSGHLPRANPQVARLRADPRAAVLLLGPNAYVSPSWMRNRRWAPTWNFASAQCLVEVRFLEEDEALAAHLHELVTTMEDGRPQPWEIAEMGDRYGQLAPRIVAFEASLSEVRERFKLGQDEGDPAFSDMSTALERDGEHELREWMTRFNTGRGRES